MFSVSECASINVYNFLNCPKNHFLQLHLQNEKELKTVEYDQDEEQVAVNSNYTDVLISIYFPIYLV